MISFFVINSIAHKPYPSSLLNDIVSAVFTCITGRPKMVKGVNTNPLKPGEDMTMVMNYNRPPKTSVASGSSIRIEHWERAIQDVGQLKADIEDLRKVSQQTNHYFNVYAPVFNINSLIYNFDTGYHQETRPKKYGRQYCKACTTRIGM